MIAIQLVLFCLIFTPLVKLGVGKNAVNGLYFYPKPVQERAFEIGLANRETTAKRRKRFMLPFLGTVLGAACVFFLKNNMPDLVRRGLTGFAAGVMVAASIWSLLIPAMEQSAHLDKWAFLWGVLSDAVEPLGALAAISLAGLTVPVLPYLLSFAAGAMIYVVVEELISELSEGNHSNIGTLCFAAGFTVMMALDVALG